MSKAKRSAPRLSHEQCILILLQTDSSPSMSLAQITKTQDKELKPVKTSKGVPQSFMVKAEPGTKGAMLTVTGEYVIPAINAEAYAKGKKERPPFVPHGQSSSEEEIDPIPDNLLCPICTKLMIDAVLMPCCGNSYCDECIRTALLDSEDHVCFTCKQSDVSPDSITANYYLRKVVNDYKNNSRYHVHIGVHRCTTQLCLHHDHNC
ncbi:E3 ubiquitin-protein ligase RBBP6-like [Gouania willdenowi]|uniref:E3 ubiquitin-protein ligase RBBP6-like n=1 Tax=Gouania willdenowi TaxID=441366 RepID=UPI0010544086|nr:E3 ubiquitin-protein ligase RBBP6-like [Gouania willdenowi]XP_028313250.1 E3 ubiquitin-protein ligase RBBP6-like [Gouania willdenowi]XP_028313258.1 E3 ubiquitin-protein ligase RBBP6-like [Gouania willdenowi]